MAVTDLTGTTWELKDALISYPTGGLSSYSRQFTVNITTSEPILDVAGNYHDSFLGIFCGYDGGAEFNRVYLAPDSGYPADLASGHDTKTLPDTWTSKRNVSFTITGGTDVTNSALISWLESNANSATPAVPAVVISYDGDTIATMDASGTEVLETNGKIMADDITIEYTSPSAPTPILQNKTVSPTTSSQSVTADSGYAGLGTVTVNAISPTKSAQTYTPTTSNQTIASGRWLTGTQTIRGDVNLLAKNIKKDVTIFSVTGTYEGSGGGDINPLNVSSNGVYTPPTGVAGYSPVIVNVTGSGSSTNVPAKDVNFIDYNGVIVYSYTATEFASLSTMPANPSQSGLTAQGWNWTLVEAKAYVAAYGKLWIGQMYTTDDGKTRVYIHLDEGRLSPMLGVGVNGTVDVDWGDGSTHDTLTGTSLSTVKWTTTHNYPIAGDYVIKLTVTNGSMSFIGESNRAAGSYLLRYSSSTNNINYLYKSSIKKIEIGTGVTSIGGYAFYACYSLSSVTIPNTVTSIGNYAFYYCYSLLSITMPNTVTSIGRSDFYYCYGLLSIAIPNTVTSLGDYTFDACYTLSSVTIPSTVTSIGSNTFSDCYTLSSVTIPNGVTSIGSYAFSTCSCLSSITLPNSLISTNMYAFYNCYALSNITIPSTVTSIGNNTFYGCCSLGFIKFKSATPPTVSGSSTWTNVPTDCAIYVPTGSLSTYTSASNYPNSNTYIYVEY